MVTLDSIETVLQTRPARLGYQIPGDIDLLMRDDPEAAIRWRQEMRQVLSQLVTTKSACFSDPAPADPTRVGIEVSPGAYVISGIATGLADSGERQSVYLLERKEHG